jgi:hypothetical protein
LGKEISFERVGLRATRVGILDKPIQRLGETTL